MWLKDSSIGRKFIMSLTGLALVLFLIFHGCMNLAVVFSEEAYNTICHLLGANWYALIGTLGLAFLVVLHFCYGIYLTIQNRAARGNDRYAVTGKKEGVEWESENMLVLGVIVIGFIVLHLYNFWFKMQFAELAGMHEVTTLGSETVTPANGGCVRSSERCGLCKGLVHYSCLRTDLLRALPHLALRALVPSPSRCLVCIAYLGLEQPRLDEAHQSDRCDRCYVGCTAVRSSCFVLPRRGNRDVVK